MIKTKSSLLIEKDGLARRYLSWRSCGTGRVILFTDAVIREIREETGLSIHSPQLCGIKDWCENQCRYVVLFYKATRFQGKLYFSEEGEVWWEDIENLPNLNLSLDMNDMLRVFMKEELSEFFYY